MVIGNPIYDTIFKFMMEDPAVASRVIGMLIGEDILELEFAAQEQIQLDSSWPLALFRMDFVATIRTNEGSKKVLIEVQKAKRETDISRFRSYLGKQYSDRKYALPIITIYFLGYNLTDLPEVVVKAQRSLVGIISGKIYEVKNEFVERLTHEAYLIQVNRLKLPLRSPVERMLSIFDQNRKLIEEYFLEYPEEEIPEEARPLAKRLQLVTKDKSLKEQLELEAVIEFEYQQTIGMREAKIAKAEKDRMEALKRAEEAKQETKAANQRIQNILTSSVLALHTAGKTKEDIAQMLNLSVEEVSDILPNV